MSSVTEISYFIVDVVFPLDFGLVVPDLFNASLENALQFWEITNVVVVQLTQGSVIASLSIRNEESYAAFVDLVARGVFNVSYPSGNTTQVYVASFATTSTTLTTVTTRDANDSSADSTAGSTQNAAVIAPLAVVFCIGVVLALVVFQRQRRRHLSDIHGPVATGTMMSPMKSIHGSNYVASKRLATDRDGYLHAGTKRRESVDGDGEDKDDPDYYR